MTPNTTPPTCPKCHTTDCRSMWLSGELIVSSTCMERQIAKLTSDLTAALAAKEGAEAKLAEWERDDLNPLLREWSGEETEMKKHVANHPDTCRRIVAQLEAFGRTEEAAWAKWIIWWLQLTRNRADRFCKEVLEVEALRLEVENNLETAEAESKALRERLEAVEAKCRDLAIVPEYDCPGDTPIVCGYECLICKASGASESFEHKADCILKTQ